MSTARAPGGVSRFQLPDLGVGVGLRVPHYARILSERPAIDFFEIISENFLVDGGKPRYHLDQVLESYSVVPHGVSLNIGGPDPIDRDYLRRLKQLVKRVEPAWLSDHACWCGAGGAHLHDLLPLPYSAEALERVVERARLVQDFLEVRFALENTSSYMSFTSSSMSEWQFLTEVAERADIGLLFDVNNVYVSAHNHAFDPLEFIAGIPHDRIVQIHLAGHTQLGTHIIDTHRGPVIDAVWRLYQQTLRFTGPVSTLIEWDDQIPELEALLAEAELGRRLRQAACAGERPEPGTFRGEQSGAPLRPPNPGAAGAWQQGGPRERARAQ